MHSYAYEWLLIIVDNSCQQKPFLYKISRRYYYLVFRYYGSLLKILKKHYFVTKTAKHIV